MIDLSQEHLISLSQAAKAVPSRPGLRTVWRWVLNGVRGRKLDSVVIGGRRFTTTEAVSRFLDGCNPNLCTPTESPSGARQRELEGVDAELAQLGL